MAIWGDDTHLFSLKMYFGGHVEAIDEILNFIAELREKSINASLSGQELNEALQKLYEIESSRKEVLRELLVELSRIICIGLREKETYPEALKNWGLDSSFIARRKPD